VYVARFAVALLKQWVALMAGTGGLIVGIIANSQNWYTGPWVFWAVAVASLIVAFYRAWLYEHREKEALKVRLEGSPEDGARRAKILAMTTSQREVLRVLAYGPSLTESQIEAHLRQKGLAWIDMGLLAHNSQYLDRNHAGSWFVKPECKDFLRGLFPPGGA
jgi:hypothetical protein